MSIQPFGSNSGIATEELGTQTFLGLTVVDFSCNSSWDGQGGECNINIIQDPEEGQYLDNFVVGSPQYFEISTTGGSPVFRFYGVLKNVQRSVSSSSKSYSATLQSPTVLLDSCYVVTDGYAGYGGALEATSPNQAACLDFGSNHANINPGSIFNVLNAYAVYENDTYGLTGAGFGRSAVNEEGMRVDFLAYAVDQLTNGNTSLTPQLGSNIIYGSDAYSNQNAYAYNFDINDFLSQIVSYIPSDYRIKSGTLLEIVDDLCSQANHVYYVDLLKPVGSGDPAFTTGHESTQTPTLTHNNTVYGGQIKIITQNRNVYSSLKFPLSSGVIVNEASDKLGASGQLGDLPLDVGMTGLVHPDGPPVASSPFGGYFPVESIIAGTGTNYINTNLNVSLNEGAVLAKYVVGGYQSRINFTSRTKLLAEHPDPEIAGTTCTATPSNIVDNASNIMCYWGTLKKSIGNETRHIPVITPYLDGHVLLSHLDIIAIDLSDFLDSVTMGADETLGHNGAVYDGVYLCSVMELRAAMNSYEAWIAYVETMKAGKLNAISDYYSDAYTSLFNPIYKSNGNLTEYGRALLYGSISAVYAYNTSSGSVASGPNVLCGRSISGFLSLGLEAKIKNTLRAIWEKIKSIGDEHYGQSFVIKMPVYTVRADQDDEAPLNSFIKSWDISDDGYLDPINYGAYEAPQSDIFVNNGRLKPYANFDHGFTSYEFVDKEYGSLGSYIIDLNGTKNYFDFRNYNYNEVYMHSVTETNDTISVQPELTKDYMLIPTAYFENYHPRNSTEYFFTLSSDNTITTQITRKTLINLTNEAIGAISYLKNVAGILDNGTGMIPFALIKIKPVFMNNASYPEDAAPTLSQLLAFVGASCTNATVNQEAAGASEQKSAFYPMAIPPRSVGIPQQSNRYVYGPWVTSITARYGAKIEYVQQTDLVPENFIIPTSFSLNGGSIDIASGYTGLNAAGNLIANTVDGFNYIFTEGGSVEIPGLPQITSLAQSLVENGPLVSDMTVNLSAQSLSTSYNMSTFAPKFGRTNKWTLDRIRKMSNRIKGSK